MKIFHDIFNKIIGLENLIASWKEFKVGKKDKPDILLFERNLEDNIWDLHQSLKNKTYNHAPYISFFIQDPKTRHIHKASVRDRILHHAIVKQLNPIFEPTFINDSYSCRISKGTHKGIERFAAYGRKISKNFTQSCWVLKCDIKKFFASIDHQILLNIIFRRIDDLDTQWLIEKIVDSFCSELTIDSNNPKGVPIGNLTSQLFANAYLNEFDQFMKHEIKEQYYVRYADDFVMLHPQREYCLKIIGPINNFLKNNLKLALHPNKISVRKFTQGVDFLGYVCFPYHRMLRPKTQHRILRKLRQRINNYKNNEITAQSLEQSFQSYLGVLSHADAYKLKQNLKNQFWFWLNE